MNFDAFDKTKIREYAEKARETWGNTPAYAEYEEKSKIISESENTVIAEKLMDIFRDFSQLKGLTADDEAVKNKVKELQDFITNNYYKCTDEILKGLGEMYAAGGEFTGNIDKATGEGTAVFVNEAIKAYFE